MFSVSFKPNVKDPTGSISASVGRIDSKWKSVTHQAGIYVGEAGYDKIYNSIGLVPNLGVGSKGKASSTTQSAISDGILTVDGKEIDTKTININTENTLHQLDKIFDKKKIEERQELARLFSKNAFEQLHNWQPTTKDGKIAKSIAHGIIGEVAARMAGNTPGSGFKATMTNEMLIEKIKKIADNDPVLAQWLSATVGGVVNKASGENVTVGAGGSSYATKWNENDKSAVEIWANKSFDVVNIGQAATAGALDFKSGVGAGSALNAEERKADNIEFTDEVTQDGFGGVKD